jgi:hypothetical protein
MESEALGPAPSIETAIIVSSTVMSDVVVLLVLSVDEVVPADVAELVVEDDLDMATVASSNYRRPGS